MSREICRKLYLSTTFKPNLNALNTHTYYKIYAPHVVTEVSMALRFNRALWNSCILSLYIKSVIIS